jgi:four helix bundle protein
MDRFLDHERLEVYQVARELNREVARILGELPRGCSESAENLARATRSITRNIAEGGGRWSSADKANFYHIARGSAAECAASLDELVDFGFVSAERVAHAKMLSWRVVSMLVGLIRSLNVPDRPRTRRKSLPRSA